MDMRTDKWHAQLQFSGVGKPHSISGSLTSILSWTLRTMQENRSKPVSGGHEINLIIRDSPFDNSTKFRESLLMKSGEVLAGLDDTDMTRNPDPGETFEQYFDYLVESGTAPISADMIARVWFGLEPNAEQLLWMSDEKAARFRRLNSVAAEFEAALPSEYSELKDYVIREFPHMVQNLTFRSA